LVDETHRRQTLAAFGFLLAGIAVTAAVIERIMRKTEKFASRSEPKSRKSVPSGD
jgi:hypothetical protein